MMMANHHTFLFPILKASIATIYGFSRMSEEDYQKKYNDGTLTQIEADDYNTPGPFSYLGYMMWQISITVVKGETFHQVQFRHSESLKTLIWFWSIAKADTMFQLVSCYVFHNRTLSP